MNLEATELVRDAQDFLEATQKVRLEMFQLLTFQHIQRLQKEHPEMGHDALDKDGDVYSFKHSLNVL